MCQRHPWCVTCNAVPRPTRSFPPSSYYWIESHLFGSGRWYDKKQCVSFPCCAILCNWATVWHSECQRSAFRHENILTNGRICLHWFVRRDIRWWNLDTIAFLLRVDCVTGTKGVQDNDPPRNVEIAHYIMWDVIKVTSSVIHSHADGSPPQALSTDEAPRGGGERSSMGRTNTNTGL